MITSEQLRAARAMLRWEQTTLADNSKVSTATIKRIEGRSGPIEANQTTIDALQRALEAAGIEFTNGGQPGVRIRKRPDNAADLTHKIDTIEADLAESKGPSAQTPAGGMRTLERAHKREAVTKLKNRRTRLGKTKK